MKRAIGKYKDVRAITKEEALSMTSQVFTRELSQAWIELNQANINRSFKSTFGLTKVQEYPTLLEFLYRKFEIALERAAKECNRATAGLCGFSPDWRAINFIAADRRNAVYCFVFCATRKQKEVWIYNGETCPNAKIIKKRGQVIWTEAF